MTMMTVWTHSNLLNKANKIFVEMKIIIKKL